MEIQCLEFGGSTSAYGNWYSSIEDFYYSRSTSLLDSHDVEEYYYRKFGRDYTAALIGYTGSPFVITNDLQYVLELRNPNTTRVEKYATIYRGRKSNLATFSYNVTERPDPVAYLELQSSLSGGNKIVAGETTTGNVICYSIGLTTLELQWIKYNSSSGISNIESVDITPSSISSGEKETYSVSFTLNSVGTGKIRILATYQDGSTTKDAMSNEYSYEVIQGGEACFTGDTPVLTSSGLVNIQDLKVGDKVISYNEETKQNEEKSITNIKSHEDYDLYYIITRTDTVRCTYDHPFYIKDKGKVLSRNLRAGDILIDKDGNERRIQSIAYSIEDTETVYDIAVEGNNTYYVGKDSILVYTEDVTKNKFKEEE